MQKRIAQKISALPLLRRLKDRAVSQTKFANENNYTPADITNWKARGVPLAELPKVAQWCQITVDAYLSEAGLPTASRPKSFEAATLLADYDALPDGLKEIVARKAAELRRFVDSLQPLFRDALDKAPTDPERYQAWEHDIADAIAHMPAHEPQVEHHPVPHAPAPRYRHKRSHG